MDKAKASIIARKRKRLFRQLFQSESEESDQIERSSIKKQRTSNAHPHQSQHKNAKGKNPTSTELDRKPSKLESNDHETSNSASTTKTSSNEKSLTNLQSKLQEQLKGGKFRWINEQLYTTPGSDAFQLFQSKPELFKVYHEGFQSQVTKWPENPLDVFINFVKRCKEPLVIGDFGCGEANLAKACDELASNGGIRHAVYSFDLVADNDYITACDIANVPLPDECLDLAVFCLSLMGTNFMDFLKEAYRVLKPGAQLKIAEVKSRIPDVQKFLDALATSGFKLTSKDDKNKMFILFDLIKDKPKQDASNKPNKKKRQGGQSHEPVLKPCLYKRR